MSMIDVLTFRYCEKLFPTFRCHRHVLVTKSRFRDFFTAIVCSSFSAARKMYLSVLSHSEGMN